MKFLINDKLTKELYGLFNTKEEAELFYVKNNLAEKLKYYCNRLVNKSELMESIELIRKFEKLLEEIYEFEKDDYKYNFSYFMTVADELLYKYCEGDKELHSKISVLNYCLLRLDDDKLNIHKY
jgi:hypothetical protein